MEPILFKCPACNAPLKVSKPELVGKKIKCPKCAGIAPVPAAGAPPKAPAAAKPAAPAPPAPKAAAPKAASHPAPAPAETPALAPAPKSSTKASGSAKTAAPGGGPGLVWVNTASNVYHCYGGADYGTTKAGKYMSEADAKAAGARPARGQACSK